MIVIAGGTGFLGQPLATRLAADGHAITVLTRKSIPGTADKGTLRAATGSIVQVQWRPDGATGPWGRTIEGADAVVNLAGESIAARWTATRKRRILQSRLNATRSLVAAISAANKPPAVFVSASAVGYYGDRGEEVLTEPSAPGSDFLADVCVQWEREAMRANGPRTRVALIRSGVALDPSGGALAKILPPFRAFVGGPLGSGRQYMSWIHRSDWVALVRWMITNDLVRGPVNATAPEPVTNAQFSKALGRALRRPSLVPAPAFALRLLLGDMADGMLLASQRVVPARADQLHFQYSYPRLDLALQALFA
jgi:uncharacterized protein (TIGR01777 family)